MSDNMNTSGQDNTAYDGSSDDTRRKPTSTATAEGVNPSDIHTEEEDLPCKWGPVKSACCNIFRNSKMALLMLCLAVCIQSMMVNGFVNVNISTWERRFDLKSTETGLIVSCYDIAVVLCLIPVTYFGGIGSKPRWLGVGSIILGIGAFVCSIPHFATGIYEYGDSTGVSDLCIIGNSTTNGTKTNALCTEKSSSVYKYVFIVGQLLFGIGASPLYTLGVTYLDENVEQKWSSMYLGIFFTMAIVGPAVGFVLGGYFLSFYTDFDVIDTSMVDITQASVSWIGAWWLGFLIFGSLSIITGLITLGFPHSLPGADKLRTGRVSEAYKGQEGVNTNTAGFGSLKQLPKSLKVLLTNPTYILLNLGGAAEGVVVSGVATFIPKYVEYQFSVSASYAALLIGIGTVVGGGIGSFFSGYIIKRARLTLTGLIKMCMITCAVATVAQLGLLAKCPGVTFAGISHSYTDLIELQDPEETLVSSCNKDCGCGLFYFNPVCGDNDVMYFTACAAGCTNYTQQTGAKIYQNCSCIDASTEGIYEGTQSARSGRCTPDCQFLIVFVVVFVIALIFTFGTGIPELSATLRSVPEQQRSLALGIQWIIVRCLGNIPGPVLYGTVIDQACLYWHQPCQMLSEGACYFYSSSDLSNYLLGITLGCKCLSLLFYFLAWLVYKPPTTEELKVTDTDPQARSIDNEKFSTKL